VKREINAFSGYAFGLLVLLTLVLSHRSAAAPRTATRAVTQQSFFSFLPKHVEPVAISPDERFLLVMDATVAGLWDLKTKQPAKFWPDDVVVSMSLSFKPPAMWAFSRDGHFLAAFAQKKSDLRETDILTFDLRLQKMTILQSPELKKSFPVFAVPTDVDNLGNMALVNNDVVEEGDVYGGSRTYVTKAAIFHPATGAIVPVQSGTMAFDTLRFSPDGTSVVAGVGEGYYYFDYLQLVVWDARTGKKRAMQKQLLNSNTRPDGFSRDGKNLWATTRRFHDEKQSVTRAFSPQTLVPRALPEFKGVTVQGFSNDDIIVALVYEPEGLGKVISNSAKPIPFWQNYLVIDARNGHVLRHARLQAQELKYFIDTWRFVGFVESGKRAAFWSQAQRRLAFIDTSRP